MHETDQAPGTRAAARTAETPAEARARAYLDLWERQLVELAVRGSDPAARPPA